MSALEKQQFNKRKFRTHSNVRKKNKGGRIRLSIFRSNKHIYVQLIDDSLGQTLASASTLNNESKIQNKNFCNIENAKIIGTLISKKAEELNIDKIVFDKGPYQFHGVVKAVADAARESNKINF